MINDGINSLFENKENYNVDPTTGLSLALLLKIFKEAKNNPGLVDLFKQLKMFYELSGGTIPEYVDDFTTIKNMRRPTFFMPIQPLVPPPTSIYTLDDTLNESITPHVEDLENESK